MDPSSWPSPLELEPFELLLPRWLPEDPEPVPDPVPEPVPEPVPDPVSILRLIFEPEMKMLVIFGNFMIFHFVRGFMTFSDVFDHFRLTEQFLTFLSVFDSMSSFRQFFTSC